MREVAESGAFAGLAARGVAAGEAQTPSFLSKGGAVVGALIRNVPGRGAIWGAIGFAVGAVVVAASIGVGLLVNERGAMPLGFFMIVPMLFPFFGAALFAVHGLYRGAARAALELERHFGLVRYVVGCVMALLTRRLGGALSNLPLQHVEGALKAALDQYTHSADVAEGSGLAAWVVRRGKLAITRRMEAYLLTAYRAEQQADGRGGGVSLEKVGHRVSDEMSRRLGEIVMSPLNKQLALSMGFYVLLASTAWQWLSMFAELAAHS